MAKQLFYSAGITASDFKTGSPTVSISSGVATFSVAQTGNIGVGDEIDYDTDHKKAYIKAKTSTSVWTVTDKLGDAPGDVSGKTVNEIKRAFSGSNPTYYALEAAIHGTTPGAANSSHLNSMNLVSLDVQLNIACYADGDDASLAKVDTSWTTDATRYIQIITPKNTSTECNTNQRHNGIRNGGGYTLKNTRGDSYRANICPVASYTKIIGIKVIRKSGNWEYSCAIGNTYGLDNNPGTNVEIAFNLAINEDLDGSSDEFLIGQTFVSATVGSAWSIHDNIAIGVSSTARANNAFRLEQSYANTEARRMKLYNNVAYGYFEANAFHLDIGLQGGSNYLAYVKNNYAANLYGSGVDYSFASDYDNADAEFAYNRSDDATAGSSNNNNTCTVANAAFLDTTMASLNLHIGSASLLVGAGIGPGSDANVSTIDIDGDSRSGSTCAIGADELVPSGYPRGQKGLDVPFERSNSWNNATGILK